MDFLFNTLNINILVFIGGAIISAFCYYCYRHTKSRPLLSCIPGVFTSLGLLGTFSSIWYSLRDLPVNFDLIYINVSSTNSE